MLTLRLLRPMHNMLHWLLILRRLVESIYQPINHPEADNCIICRRDGRFSLLYAA